MNNKKILTLSIDRTIFKEFKVRMAQMDLSNQSKLIEELMMKWTKEKSSGSKSN